MVERTWRGLLSAISQLLQRSTGEELVLQLLRVGGACLLVRSTARVFAAACCRRCRCCCCCCCHRARLSGAGLQGVLSPHHPSPPASCLQGYQVFTQACGNLPLLEPRDAFLANLCDFALASAPDGGEAEMSPRSAAALPPAAEKMVSPRGSLAAAGGEAAAESGLVLAPKNVQSMRTLFNIAHRLSNVLGPSWSLVLETLFRLDRILNSPRTTTQVRCSSSRRPTAGCRHYGLQPGFLHADCAPAAHVPSPPRLPAWHPRLPPPRRKCPRRATTPPCPRTWSSWQRQRRSSSSARAT